MIYDYAVIGLGVAGMSALSHLSTLGSAIGFEQFKLFHDRGSTHGETRAIRQAYFEHPSYVPLLLDAYREWESLEEYAAEKLLHKQGCLIIGGKDSQVIDGCLKSANRFSLPHEVLSAEAISERFPEFTCGEKERAFYEPLGGYLNLDACMSAFYKKAKKYNAVINQEECVKTINKEKNYFLLNSSIDSYKAKKIVIASGPWLQASNFITAPVSVKRVILSWYKTNKGLKSLPVFFRDGGSKPWVYGFPEINGLVKCSFHNYYSDCSADQINRVIGEDEERFLRELVSDFLPGLCKDNISSKTCMYTMTKDEHFIFDFHPEYGSNAIVIGGLSGHGFKFSSIFGKLVEESFGNNKMNALLEHFKISRFV